MLTAVRACARVLQAAMAKSLASTMAGMSAPQGLLVATAVTGYVSWSYSSAAKLKDNMETQVYVRRRPQFPANLRVRAWTHASVALQGYPLRMEEEVKQLHKLAELQRSKDKAMEVRQADEAKSSIKAK
jgi:hypothetical protein